MASGSTRPRSTSIADTAGPCVSCTPYSCHRDNVAGDSRLTGPEDRTMSDSYEFATHRSSPSDCRRRVPISTHTPNGLSGRSKRRVVLQLQGCDVRMDHLWQAPYRVPHHAQRQSVQMAPVRTRPHPPVRSVVPAVCLKLSRSRGHDARAGPVCRPYDDLSMGAGVMRQRSTNGVGHS